MGETKNEGMTRREKSRIHNTGVLMTIAAEQEFDVKAMCHTQLRFTLEEHGTFDFYPVSNKVNKVGTGEYIQLTGSIADWILDKKTYNSKQ